MGYYTTYRLKQPEEWTEEMKQALVEIQPDYFPTTDPVDDWLNDDFDDCKWYDHETNMIELSDRFQEVLFQVHCRGEDGSEWINYFMNGKSTTCYGEVVFEKFDQTKLK